MARLNPDFGEVAAEVSWSDGPPREGLPAHRLELASDSQQVAATLELETALALLLDSRPLGPPAEVLAPPRKTAGDESLREGNLDLLLDVELGVTLRFGSRRAPLREVLELSPGAVLELNREIQEPVDLLLNERVIARGEVVVVDGNYGLSVTEVLAPEPHRKGVL
jgi:flagellar motor switch protein FliN/FliY